MSDIMKLEQIDNIIKIANIELHCKPIILRCADS